MPCGMITPSAQLGKSWSKAWNDELPRTRPFRNSEPRCSFAFVSVENHGLPASSCCRTSSPIRSNCASRSGCLPPARSLRFWCRRIPASSIHLAMASRPTGVPISSSLSDRSSGESSVKTISSSSGSPAVRTSRPSIRLSSSALRNRFFFDRRRTRPAAGSSCN